MRVFPFYLKKKKATTADFKMPTAIIMHKKNTSVFLSLVLVIQQTG